jgi:hypothetical protein
MAATPDVRTPLVTIEDASGVTVTDRMELTLYQFGETYLSSPVTLKTSEGTHYQLTEFLVLGEDHDIVYATPREESEMAHLVADPLAISFAISKDVITTVSPEVLAIGDAADAESYGYGQFGFNVVRTISAVFSSFIKGKNNFELTDSHLRVEGLMVGTDHDTTVI